MHSTLLNYTLNSDYMINFTCILPQFKKEREIRRVRVRVREAWK